MNIANATKAWTGHFIYATYSSARRQHLPCSLIRICFLARPLVLDAARVNLYRLSVAVLVSAPYMEKRAAIFTVACIVLILVAVTMSVLVRRSNTFWVPYVSRSHIPRPVIARMQTTNGVLRVFPAGMGVFFSLFRNVPAVFH